MKVGLKQFRRGHYQVSLNTRKARRADVFTNVLFHLVIIPVDTNTLIRNLGSLRTKVFNRLVTYIGPRNSSTFGQSTTTSQSFQQSTLFVLQNMAPIICTLCQRPLAGPGAMRESWRVEESPVCAGGTRKTRCTICEPLRRQGDQWYEH